LIPIKKIMNEAIEELKENEFKIYIPKKIYWDEGIRKDLQIDTDFEFILRWIHQ
jgi:hypothetical protein